MRLSRSFPFFGLILTGLGAVGAGKGAWSLPGTLGTLDLGAWKRDRPAGAALTFAACPALEADLEGLDPEAGDTAGFFFAGDFAGDF